MTNITVFTKDNCIQCKMTKKTLEQYGISFEERNVSQDAEALKFLKGQGYQSVPVVMAQDFEPINGFRPDLLATLMEAI
ncbi:glutaredoxin-like protein NrdH [Weissella oryzae SG25]|uniref:Glutaredoxin-like protein NrdH n=1 Tax=Weissella oryzae (strain DSM 25784 / JCM 18191 / LMG 30913 / SG25) TaxID=1329250 RepID=A0A069CTN0_WEIOS|nr:glutaredoxin-like protein NrdH [Weissella oryzae]GAK30603.1 glutaredoxin-like protein NrdH [Weissella oryzae SG25]